MISKARIIAALIALSVLIAGAAALFTLAPGIDLATSRLFATEAGFPANANPALQIFREFAWWSSIALCLLSLAMTLVTALRKTPTQRIATRTWGFALSLYLLAPILLVNAILKEHWGRARPRSIEAFGGDKLFTPALDITDQCARNCSFVSGEASGIVATALILTLIVAPALTKGRTVFLTVIWALAAATSGLRIAMGGHFLSDVVFGALFTALIAGALYLGFRLYNEPASATPANVARDIRDLFHRSGA